jgi:hypothetical protein
LGSFATIHDVSVELRHQIFDALNAAPDIDFGLEGFLERISLVPPGDRLASEAVASLYLYHLDVSPHLRNQQFLPDRERDDQFRRPPLPLQLRYLFTPVDEEEEVNQLVLGRVLQHFHDFPSFGTLSGAPIGDSFGGASPDLRVKPDLLSLEQLSQLWNALSEPYRVALSLVVEVVAVDSARPPAHRKRVGELLAATGVVAR